MITDENKIVAVLVLRFDPFEFVNYQCKAALFFLPISGAGQFTARSWRPTGDLSDFF